MMLGTPAYMAPEQALGKSREIDGTTDNWSVGATMFSLLSGVFVHEGESATELVVKSATQPARSLTVVAPHIDPRVVEIVDRALGFEKSARWPTAIAMRDAVRATYLAIFGAKIGKEPLERLVAQTSAWMGQTVPVDVVLPPAPPPRVSTPPVQATPLPRLEPTRDMTAWLSASAARQPLRSEAQRSAPTRDMSVIPMPAGRPSAWPGGAPSDGGVDGSGPSGAPRPAVVGASTARPVQTVASMPPQAASRSQSLALLIGLVAAVTLVAVFGIGWLILSRGSNAAAIASAPAETAGTLAPAASVSAPSPTVPQVAAPLVGTDLPRASPPPNQAPPRAPASHFIPLPTAWPAPPLPSPPTPAQAASRAPTQPNCDPPFTINLSGHRVPKPECL
jgi:hypothetical protein